jgi:hypothetical protein
MSTVREVVAPVWEEYVSDEVMQVQSTSIVGMRVITYLLAAHATLLLSEDQHVRHTIGCYCAEQCALWLYPRGASHDIEFDDHIPF